ncbi:LacI family transcriptional regulator [Spirilliplanes yamanashiensis]|uniref:LacI family transcriptional regulator n=1 Tax=Spirilliplanes yamanashiensis TaxID=42233 RepID=A0A8J3Y7R1_9ACTN|nr:LacI family transcriptional regulator [Spirilliplanes yamanashiensis]
MPVRRPTIDQVARHAGVGRGTVSRVINGSAHVSDEARAAVHAAVAELGYVPNRAARALVTDRTDSIAIVVSETGERFFAEPFFGLIVRAIGAALNDAEQQLILITAGSPAERARLEHYLTRQHVDGAVLLSLHGDDPLPGQLEERGIATVRVGRPPAGAGGGYWVDADNEGGSRQAVAHLAARARHRIGAIAGPQDMVVGQARLAGFRAVAGDAAPVEYGDFSDPSGAAAMTRLLEREPGLDGVVAASDAMAAGALRVLRAAGRRVPEDVAVVGFDDSVIAAQTDPPLTSVHQPVDRMGRELVALLLSRLRGGEDPGRREIVLGTELVVRRSS